MSQSDYGACVYGEQKIKFEIWELASVCNVLLWGGKVEGVEVGVEFNKPAKNF